MPPDPLAPPLVLLPLEPPPQSPRNACLAPPVEADQGMTGWREERTASHAAVGLVRAALNSAGEVTLNLQDRAQVCDVVGLPLPRAAREVGRKRYQCCAAWRASKALGQQLRRGRGWITAPAQCSPLTPPAFLLLTVIQGCADRRARKARLAIAVGAAGPATGRRRLTVSVIEGARLATTKQAFRALRGVTTFLVYADRRRAHAPATAVNGPTEEPCAALFVISARCARGAAAQLFALESSRVAITRRARARARARPAVCQWA